METPHDAASGPPSGSAPPPPLAPPAPAAPSPVLLAPWTAWHTLALVIIAVAVVGAGLVIPSAAHVQPSPRLWSWLETFILLAAFVMRQPGHRGPPEAAPWRLPCITK